MATDISVTAWGAEADELEAAIAAALEVFHQVEAECTRFDPASPLMQANANNDRPIAVPSLCFAALTAAAHAYERTDGRFDPRVHDDLRRLGYTRSMGFETGHVEVDDAEVDGRADLAPWRPTFDARESTVHLDGSQVDLGGIGKGLAVRWASAVLRRTTADYLVEAGGDCYAAGSAPDGGAWRVGVEDPLGAPDPLLVLEVADRAVTTSSIRIRRWTAGDRPVHHLIDPRTGLPGGIGVLAVTVVGSDPAVAEVDAKVLFLEGSDRIAAAATDIAACWVTEDGELMTTPHLERCVMWRRQ
jgi:thiamine biosynthesis lipoprotein